MRFTHLVRRRSNMAWSLPVACHPIHGHEFLHLLLQQLPDRSGQRIRWPLLTDLKTKRIERKSRCRGISIISTSCTTVGCRLFSTAAALLLLLSCCVREIVALPNGIL
jgi:hypothetical protein